MLNLIICINLLIINIGQSTYNSLGENFSTFVTSVARKSTGQLARKMIVVRPCINA